MAEHALDLIACQDEKPDDDPTWAPILSTRGITRRAPVPTELTLNGSDVVEPRLDLDDQEGFAPGLEGDDIDPTM